MAEIDVDGVKVNTDTLYNATVQSSFIDSAGLPWADLAIKELPSFGPMKIYFHVGTFKEEPFRNLNSLLPKGLEIQAKVRAYDLNDVREQTEFDKGWRLKVTSAQVGNLVSRKVLESLMQKTAKSNKPGRIKITPEGDDSLRAAYNNFHTKEIQTFDESKKLDSQRVRLSSASKFTLIDLQTGNVLENAGRKAENVLLYEWDTNATGIESLGIKFMGSRELSFRLVHVGTGETIAFRLIKV
jgi:hypothetical protein